MHEQEQEQQYVMPPPVGTRLVYYNKAQCREMEAIVKDSGYVILWVIDQEKCLADEHYISYKDIVRLIRETEQ